MLLSVAKKFNVAQAHEALEKVKTYKHLSYKTCNYVALKLSQYKYSRH